MAEMMKTAGKPPAMDDVVEGPVVATGRARVFVDLAPYGTGIIYGREYLSARETLKNVNIGDLVTAKVVGIENADGYIELSLREARQALTWGEAEIALQKKTSASSSKCRTPTRAALSSTGKASRDSCQHRNSLRLHYPRVADGDKDKIFVELKRMIGTKIEVMIITASSEGAEAHLQREGRRYHDRAHVARREVPRGRYARWRRHWRD